MNQPIDVYVAVLLTYNDVGNQKEMAETPGKAAVTLEVVKLVAKLGRDTESVFEKGDDYEETGNGWDMRFQGLADLVNRLLDLARVFLYNIHGYVTCACEWFLLMLFEFLVGSFDCSMK